jgi:hypothetical protein
MHSRLKIDQPKLLLDRNDSIRSHEESSLVELDTQGLTDALSIEDQVMVKVVYPLVPLRENDIDVSTLLEDGLH